MAVHGSHSYEIDVYGEWVMVNGYFKFFKGIGDEDFIKFVQKKNVLYFILIYY